LGFRRALGAAALGAVLVAPVARADDVYLTEEDAPAAVFPDATRFERSELPSTPELRARIAARLGDVKPTVWESRYKVAAAFRDHAALGRAIEVEEIGKHRAITLVVGVDPQAKVTGVAVMVYREAYGGEIRTRRFLDQYRGKTTADPLLPSQDIRNITGATLSARAVGRAVKKAIAVAADLPKPTSEDSVPAASADRPLTSPGRGAVMVREAHYVMGTILEVTVVAPSTEVGRSWIHRAVSEARRLDAELTSFAADSALMRLNRAAGGGYLRVPADLYRVLALSKSLSTETGGAFDVTVAPLVRLWEAAAAAGRRPTARELADARRATGAGGIELRPPSEVALRPSSAVELGGVGKGYAADRLADTLRDLGADAALVNFGESSIAAVGPPPGRPAWSIWIRRGEGFEGPIFLRDGGLSTSNAFGRSFRIGGRTFGHIIDPRTGEPLESSAQATVIAPTATEAEAWSKALLVDERRSYAALSHRPSLRAVLFPGVANP